MITLTEAASNHIKNKLTQHQTAIGFRLSIKKTGCSGYAYVSDLIDVVNENDIRITDAGLDIYIDPKCVPLLTGLVIDYVTDDNEGLKQKRLVFINPNEKNRCGCGESFTIE